MERSQSAIQSAATLRDTRAKALLRDHGACRGARPDSLRDPQALDEVRPQEGENVVVMPGLEDGLKEADRRREVAKKICRTCDVARICFGYTTSHGIYAPIQDVVADDARRKSMADHPSTAPTMAEVIPVDFGRSAE